MNAGVAVKPTVRPTMQVGKIIIPDTAKAKSDTKEGVVIGTGKGTAEKPMEVSAGDRVIYKGNEYPTSEGCDIIAMDDILFVI